MTKAQKEFLLDELAWSQYSLDAIECDYCGLKRILFTIGWWNNLCRECCEAHLEEISYAMLDKFVASIGYKKLV